MSQGNDLPVPPRWSRRGETAAVCAAVLVGVALRAARIDAPEIDDDEAFSWRMVGFPWGEMLRRLGDDVHPPLYYLLLKGWVALFGPAPASIRGLSVALGGLTIVVAARLAARVVGETTEGRGRAAWAGVLTALLVALSPAQVAAGRTARMYALGTFLAASSALVLLDAARGGRGASWRWAVAGGLAGAFLLTHPYAVFTAAALAAFVGSLAASAAAKGDRRDVLVLARGGALAGAAMLALYLPWLPAQLTQVRAIRANYWIPDVTPARVLAEASYFATGLRALGAEGEAWGTALGVAALGALVVRRAWGRWLLLLLVVVPWVGAVGVSTLGGRSVFLGRYLTFAHLFYLTGLGVVAATLRPRNAPALLAAALLLNFAYEDAQAFPSPQPALRPLVRFLATDRRRDRPVLASSAGSAVQFQYYAAVAGSPGFPLELRVVGTQDLEGKSRVHGAAIAEAQWVAPEELAAWEGGVAWGVGRTPTPIAYPAHWRVDHWRAFGGRTDRRWYLVRYKVGRKNGAQGDETHLRPRPAM